MTLSSYTIRPAQVLCYVRSARAGRPSVSGGYTGWVHDPRLICVQVTSQTGPAVGSATFIVQPQSVVGAPAESPAVEALLAHYTTDDQVRVVLAPYADAAQGDAVTVLFEGVLDRHSPTVSAAEGGKSEELRLTARPMPAALDGDMPGHVITGRWMSDLRTFDRPESIGPTQDVYICEAPSLPATFNFRGRPNMHSSIKLRCEFGDRLVESAVFSHDNDPDAQYWTVGDAIAAIIAVWGLGPSELSAAWARNFDVDVDLLAAIQDPGAVETDGVYRGWDTPLPEVSVQGLGLWEALDRVCKAAGCDFSLTPTQDGPPVDADLPNTEDPGDPESPPASPTYDRRYVLRVWARGRGPLEWLDLPPRSARPESAEEFHRTANTAQLAVIRDARELVNVYEAHARELIECRLVLRPLWSPDLVSATLPAAYVMQPADEDLADTGTWPARHVSGGAEFAAYGHVGRLWGIACLSRTGLYYTSGVYQQPYLGYDWAAELQLNADGSDVLQARREAQISDPTIRWSKRVRPLMPLRSPEARARAVEYHLEVSETEGLDGTWHPAPSNLQYSVLRDQCAIRLSVANLAGTNLESLRTQEPVSDPTQSWWNLIRLQQLLFRITCVVEADHAYRVDAPRRASSGSAYEHMQCVSYPIERTWVQPGTLFNSSARWTQITGWSDSARQEGQDPDLAALVTQRQEWLEALRQTGRGDLPFLEPARYAPGTRLAGVRGRGIDFGLGGGEAKAYPNIIAVTWTLTPGEAQSTALTIDDQAYAPAVVGGQIGGGRG